MKTFEVPQPSGGHRFFPLDDMTHIAESIKESVLALGAFHGQNYYLQPGVHAIAGGFADIAAGAMIYKGELCLFDAQHVAVVGGQTLYWVPDITYRYLDPIVYADASNKSPHKIKKVKLQYAAAPPADYVLPANVKQPSLAIFDTIHAAWVKIGDSGTAFSANFAHVASPDQAVYVRYNPDIREFHFKGICNRPYAAGDIAAGTFTPIFTLPAGMRPARGMSVTVMIQDYLAPNPQRFAVLRLLTTGVVGFECPTALTEDIDVLFDGIRLFE